MLCLFLPEVTTLRIILPLIMKTEWFLHLYAILSEHLARAEKAYAFETGLIFFSC